MNRTQEAQLLLGNEFFKEDINGRELAYVKLATLREIKSHIESIAASSEIRDKRWKIW
jgi:hypothetical protein